MADKTCSCTWPARWAGCCGDCRQGREPCSMPGICGEPIPAPNPAFRPGMWLACAAMWGVIAATAIAYALR